MPDIFTSMISNDTVAAVMNGYQALDPTISEARGFIMLIFSIIAILIAPMALSNLEGDDGEIARLPRREIKILFWTLFGPAFLTLLVNLQLAYSHLFARFDFSGEVAGMMRDHLWDYFLAALACTGMALIVRYDKTAEAIGLQRATWRPTPRDRERIVSEGLIVGLAATVAAFIVFFHCNYRPSLFVKEFNQWLPYYIPEIQRTFFLAAMIKAVVYEELFYRLFIQGLTLWALVKWLGVKRREAALLAILFSALLWTWAHSKSFEFSWAKYLQIFPIGIMLGFLAERRGVWACILAHFLHNALILFYKAVFHYLPPL